MLTNRIELCDRKRFYRNRIHRKKRSFTLKQARKFESLKHQRAKDFWSFFRKTKQSHANIPTEDYQNVFSSLLTDIRTTMNEEVEHLNENSGFNTNNPTFYELNAPITIAEVEYAIKQLNKNKA